MALGASAGLVQRGVLAQTLRLALAGVVLGTLGSFALTKWIESLLFGTTPTDPTVFSGVILLLCSVALVAGYVPARRASRIDPMKALRTEWLPGSVPCEEASRAIDQCGGTSGAECLGYLTSWINTT